MPVISVTGANGFIGAPLLRFLVGRGETVLPIVRPGRVLEGFPALRHVSRIDDPADWSRCFSGADAVVHLLSLAHDNHSPAAIEQVNHHGAVAAAKGAIIAGVKRFVFVSTAHVYGVNWSRDVVSDDSPRNPHSAYAASKCRAEDALLALVDSFPRGLVILRPPLVYGENPKGNILKLVRALHRGFPLPFASLRNNKRSMIDLRNFHDAIHAAVRSDKSGAYVVCDAEPVSIPEMVAALARGAGTVPWMLPFPAAAYAAMSRLPLVGALVGKMTGPLVYDCSRFREDFQWTPRHVAAEGLSLAAASVHWQSGALN